MIIKKLTLVGLSSLCGLFVAFTPMPNDGDPVVTPSPWIFEAKKLCDKETGNCVHTGKSKDQCAYTSAYLQVGKKLYLVSSCYNAAGGADAERGKVYNKKVEIE